MHSMLVNHTVLTVVQFSFITQSCLTLCDPMDCSTPGLLVHHQPTEPTQTPVHWVGDAIQPLILCRPFSSHLQPFPASGFSPMNQFFASGGQSIGVSASALVLPMNIQNQFLLGLTGWISLLSKGLNSLLQHHSSKALIFWCSVFFTSPTLTFIHDQWKNHSFA